MSHYRANKEDAGSDGYCRGCGTTIGEEHHAGCDLARIAELERQFAMEIKNNHTHVNQIRDMAKRDDFLCSRIADLEKQLEQAHEDIDGLPELREASVAIRKENNSLREEIARMKPIYDLYQSHKDTSISTTMSKK